MVYRYSFKRELLYVTKCYKYLRIGNTGVLVGVDVERVALKLSSIYILEP